MNPNRRAILGAALAVWAPRQSEAVAPVIVVSDEDNVRWALRSNFVPFDAVFLAPLRDAQAARRDLPRFVHERMKRAKDQRYALGLRRVLLAEKTYLWHCAGFEKSGSRFLFCSVVRYHDGDDYLAQPRFPEIFDGGTDVCRCIFSFRAGQIITFGWNGEV